MLCISDVIESQDDTGLLFIDIILSLACNPMCSAGVSFRIDPKIGDSSGSYVYVTTNGWYMTKDIANKLAEAGVNRVSVSIDSMDEDTHDKFRGRKGSWKRAIDALEMVQ